MKTAFPHSPQIFRALALAGLAALSVACGPSPAALREAVLANDVVEVRRLIERGVDVNQPDSAGATALTFAAREDNLELAQLLIAHGADVNVSNAEQIALTPLHHAVTQGHREMVELLLAHGALVEARTEDNQTPLMLADQHGHKDLVILLRAHGARQ